MKVIFLDIDGVLTTATWASNYREFNPVCTNGLLKILDADPEIQLVISSTWRGGKKDSVIDPESRLYRELEKYDLIKKLHKDWQTIHLYDLSRGHEIQDWLDRHPEVENYVILDDDGDMLDGQREHFVHTATWDGMLLAHLDHAIKIFGIEMDAVKWNKDFIECKLIKK